MRSTVPDLKVDVVPNGVGEDFSSLPKKIHYNHTILYMANYKWIQNWEAVELLANKVFPLIRREILDAKLIIAGQFPTPQVKALAGKDVEVVELEDDDFKGVVNSYLKSGIFIAPMYAPGGTRLKILAAMASMVPVVTTPIGAEGYGAIDNESILIGDTPEDLARIAVEALENKKLYEDIASEARHLVDTKFSWEPISRKLESIYEEIINSNLSQYTQKLLKDCLESVYRFEKEVDFEVIVVDNGSTDGSLEMVKRDFPQVKTIKSETNLGFARGNNLARRMVEGEYILFLNSDTVLKN